MNTSATLDRLIDFYQTLSPEAVARFPELYADDAWFKDPFNEVRGVVAIQNIFSHMFRQVAEPRFVVTERFETANAAMLVWEFHCRMHVVGRGETLAMRGVSHLRFDERGRVSFHRDYWDAAEELYMKLPAIGCLMRGLRRAIAA